MSSSCSHSEIDKAFHVFSLFDENSKDGNEDSQSTLVSCQTRLIIFHHPGNKEILHSSKEILLSPPVIWWRSQWIRKSQPFRPPPTDWVEWQNDNDDKEINYTDWLMKALWQKLFNRLYRLLLRHSIYDALDNRGKEAAYPIEVEGVCPHQPKPVKKEVMSIRCGQYVAINLEECSLCTSQFILWSKVDSFEKYFNAQCATSNLRNFFTCKRCRARV